MMASAANKKKKFDADEDEPTENKEASMVNTKSQAKIVVQKAN